MKKQNICLVNTVYSLFLYFLIQGYNKEDIFIFTFLMPKEISKNINHIQLPKVVFSDGPKIVPINSFLDLLENILGYIRYFYGYFKLRLLLYIKTFNKNVEIYGHAQTPFSYIFYENKNSNIIEDGLMNYSYPIIETHKINPIIDGFLHFCGIYFLNASEGLGSHKYIKNVYLTHENNHPLIKDKVKIIDIEKNWRNLSEEHKIKILEIFNIHPNDFKFNESTVLILTQPFFEDGVTTLDEELHIYSHFIEKFKNYDIIIKPHPRDSKNYETIFPNIKLLDKFFPIELLHLTGVNPSIVCCVSSTACLNFKHSQIYIYPNKLNEEQLIKSRKELLKLIEDNAVVL